MMKLEITVCVVVITILALFPVSADFSDWIKTITGNAVQQDVNVSVSLTGVNPVTVTIINSTLVDVLVDPTETTYTTINFDVYLTDSDGVEDINDTSVKANFTKTDEATRIDTNCPHQNDLNTTTANFSCTIEMWYFDAPGLWTITAEGNDKGNRTAQAGTKLFTYDSLLSMTAFPYSVSWAGVSPGQTNRTSGDDPILMNNTGNYNVTNVTFEGIHLWGETITTSFIGAGNISVDVDTGGSPPVECGGGTALVNGSQRQVANAQLLRGNYSIGDGSTGQEQLYFCMTTVPFNIPSQTYSTTIGGPWRLRIVQ